MTRWRAAHARAARPRGTPAPLRRPVDTDEIDHGAWPAKRRRPLRAPIVSGDDRNLPRMEAARPLAAARERVRSSEARVASSIVRLLSCDRRLSQAAITAMGTIPELGLFDVLAHPCDL